MTKDALVEFSTNLAGLSGLFEEDLISGDCHSTSVSVSTRSTTLAARANRSTDKIYTYGSRSAYSKLWS